MQRTSYKRLTLDRQKLLKAAAEAMKNDYNPYSHFYVGAAILTSKGKIITGSNVENAAYGSSICAERSALVRMTSEGNQKAVRMAIIGQAGKKAVDMPVTPCGACRQMIIEAAQFSAVDVEVIMSNTKMDKIIIATISELLPLAFGPNNLKK
ncbi:MAG: cytidine deaminase [Candidatus Falkowbacteria bacterium]